MAYSTQQPHLLLKGSIWFLVVMIFGMIVLGGLTRLTGSGLSMVEWHPISGILPPLSTAQWLTEFAHYQASPEFLKVYPDMDLSHFKSIFWLEYIHRLWGRLLGIILLVPSLIIYLMPHLKAHKGQIALLWCLGIAQGFLGWYMVKSGLIHDPHVSPYRLAAHLILGFAIFGVALHTALSLNSSPPSVGHSRKALKKINQLGLIGLCLLLFTVTLGAFVAGLNAGLIYNTFPKMGDTWIPSEIFFQSPFWSNFTENAAMVQLLHRLLATATGVYCLYFCYTTFKRPLPNTLMIAALALAALVLIQYGLGIATLLLHVPTVLGVLHQGWALLVFGVMVYIVSTTRRMQ